MRVDVADAEPFLASATSKVFGYGTADLVDRSGLYSGTADTFVRPDSRMREMSRSRARSSTPWISASFTMRQSIVDRTVTPRAQVAVQAGRRKVNVRLDGLQAHHVTELALELRERSRSPDPLKELGDHDPTRDQFDLVRDETREDVALT
ncbi:MAG TPA: hypothetical protein VLD39_17475 [Gammaproteobacteria bacterium]|nr:hypothetical protein [Gammaproteobacteria bacterium]